MQHENETGENHVHMPLPTAWPFVLALGVTLVVTGMVTNVAISLLGLLLTLAAAVGWFRNVLPVEAHELVEAHEVPLEIASTRTSILISARPPSRPRLAKTAAVATRARAAGCRR